MRTYFILSLLCHCLLGEVKATLLNELDYITNSADSTVQESYTVPSNGSSTSAVTSVLKPSENKTVIEPVRCYNDQDCQSYHIDSEATNKVICDRYIGICIIGLIEEIGTIEPASTSRSATTTSTNKPENGIETTVTGPSDELTSSLSVSTTSSSTTPPQVVVIDDSEFHSIPVVVWVLFTIPFISIIILGIICGRRLKMQSENIQENLLRTTINGVHVDQLLSQRDLIQSIAFSRPPPTYEKATGEIPPGYETVLKSLQEKRQSIFQSDSLMGGDEDKEQHNCDNRSLCSACSSSLGRRSRTANSSRTSPIIYTISRNNFPV